MKCPNCFKRINDDSKFCNYCGQKIEHEIVCNECGTKNELGSKFCKNCGAPLNKVETPSNNETVENSDNPHKARFVLSIISMSLMLLSMFLVFVISFTPFLTSSFFPDGNYTIIGYINNILSVGAKELFDNYKQIPFINAIVMLVLLLSLLTLTGILLGFSIAKFVKSIKNKEYFDFSKRLMEIFILFIGVYVYFTRFALNQTLKEVDGLGGGVLFLFIFIPLILAFNAYVRELYVEKHNLKHLIMRLSSYAVIFVITMVYISLIGGDRIHIVFRYINSASYGTKATYSHYNANGLGLIEAIIIEAPNIYKDALTYLLPAIILSGLSMVFELASLVLLLRLLKRCVIFDSSKREKYSFGLVTSIILFVLNICIIAFNSTAVGFLNKIEDIHLYEVAINSYLINVGLVVTCLIFSVFFIAHYIVMMFIDKKEEVEGNNNE